MLKGIRATFCLLLFSRVQRSWKCKNILCGRECMVPLPDGRTTSTNLECRSEMCCTRLAGNAGPNKIAKNGHLGNIAQICRAISLQLRHVSTIGKKLFKQQYLPYMSSQYGEHRPTNSWDPFGSLGHSSKFQRVSHLRSVTARHSSSGRQPNWAALNRERHLYSARRPSRWTLAHIVVCLFIDSACQRASKIGLIRLIFITTKVRINGLTNVTTVNNSFFIAYHT